MNTIDLSPLYRTSIGFDRLSNLLDNAFRADSVTSGYPPYNIEILDENRYAITVAVAGFDRSEIDISVEQGVLSVRGRKADESERKYLHQGIANRAFERKFSLADYVEVKGADLVNGLLTINLVKEIPEAMKPRKIDINRGESKTIEHKVEGAHAA